MYFLKYGKRFSPFCIWFLTNVECYGFVVHIVPLFLVLRPLPSYNVSYRVRNVLDAMERVRSVLGVEYFLDD